MIKFRCTLTQRSWPMRTRKKKCVPHRHSDLRYCLNNSNNNVFTIDSMIGISRTLHGSTHWNLAITHWDKYFSTHFYDLGKPNTNNSRAWEVRNILGSYYKPKESKSPNTEPWNSFFTRFLDCRNSVNTILKYVRTRNKIAKIFN